jgi:hypothetical protein
MRLIPAIALLLGCGPISDLQRDRVEVAIRQWNLTLDPEPLSRVEVISIPGSSLLCAAIIDYLREWSGTFGVYHVSDGVVDWQAGVKEEPVEQSIHRIRCFKWRALQGPVIEVLGITHMGNGYLYLYELRGRQLELLLRTPAVDFNANPDRFRNGVLEITYDSSRSSLLPDVVLAGAIEVLAEQEEKVLRSFPCQRRFSWDPSLRQYREELSQRVGFLEGSD